jgi:predicted AAA+ superfamily ATPase
MMLQYAREQESQGKITLYVSADNSLVNTIGLFELGRSFYKEGGSILFIDEVHKYPAWTQSIKNLYDSCPKLQIIASGSSSLDVTKGQYDLSRRSVVTELRGLSFREFLKLAYTIELPKHTLSDILQNHQKISQTLKRAVESKNKKILPLFREYLRSGYFPFLDEGKAEYGSKLRNALSKVLYEDIPSVFNVNQSTITVFHKLISLVASSHSFTPNIAKLSSQLGFAKESIYNFLSYLDQSKIFISLQSTKSGLKRARKPQRIYLNNPNLYFIIEGSDIGKTNIGAIRESFVLNQLSEAHEVKDVGIGDFFIDNQWLFEVGGKNKDAKQIRSQKSKSYIIKDEIETGAERSIPLYLLGLLY